VSKRCIKIFRAFNIMDVRPPDDDITDTLVNHEFAFLDTEEEIQRLLEMTQKEYEFQENQQLMAMYKEEEKERLHKFPSLTQQCKKLVTIDAANSKWYNSLLSIIQMYEDGYINTYELEEDEYIQLFNLIRTMRIKQDEILALEKLIGLQK